MLVSTRLTAEDVHYIHSKRENFIMPYTYMCTFICDDMAEWRNFLNGFRIGIYIRVVPFQLHTQDIII